MGSRTARRVLIGVLVCALVLLLADQRGSQPTALLRSTAGMVLGPPERLVAWARDEVGARVSGSADRDRIAQLEAELAQARSDAAAAAAGRLEESTLRELAAAVPASGYRAAPAALVSVSSSADQVGSAAFQAESGEDLTPGLAVVDAAGLVGLVESVAGSLVTVRLVTDSELGLSARVALSGELGLYRGTGDLGAMTLLDPLGAMAVGNLVVTVPTADGAVPADLPVGRIIRIDGSAADLTRSAAVRPLADLSTLDRVVVLVPEAVAP